MTDRIAVGTPVTVSYPYGVHKEGNADNLVVLRDSSTGYGVGLKGNDPARHHNGEKGWLYYSNACVHPKPQESKVTKFKAGDKVEFVTRYKEYTPQPIEIGTPATFVGIYKYDKELVEVELTTGPRKGQKTAIFPKRIKLIEEPAALKGFTVGDKVRYNGNLWQNLEGTVSAINGSYIDVLVTKLHDNASPHTPVQVGKTLTETCGGKGVSPSSLEKIEPRFTFADIQVGDTIRRTATYKGATEVREGVVGTKGSYYFANEQGNYILAYDTDGKGSITDVTLELLNRPEPVKEAWETAKAGDRLVVKASNGATRVLTKQKSGMWETLVITASGLSHIGFTRTDADLKEQLSLKSYNVDGNHKFYAL